MRGKKPNRVRKTLRRKRLTFLVIILAETLSFHEGRCRLVISSKISKFLFRKWYVLPSSVKFPVKSVDYLKHLRAIRHFRDRRSLRQ